MGDGGGEKPAPVPCKLCVLFPCAWFCSFVYVFPPPVSMRLLIVYLRFASVPSVRKSIAGAALVVV